MEPISLPTAVHRELLIELVAKAPLSIVDDIVLAVCERIRAVDKHETGHPSQLERAARVLRAFEKSVHLAPLIYDALPTSKLRVFLVLALDRFAIDAFDAELDDVVTAARSFLRAAREPAVAMVNRHDGS